MKRSERSTRSPGGVGGIDVGKTWLDGAVHGGAEPIRVRNDEAGWRQLCVWFEARDVGRVGLEASGGYERRVRAALEAEGLEVVVHQPLEVRLFARLKRRRAKNDRIDAQVIAAATAQVDTVRSAQDPRLQELAERLTAYEHVRAQAAQLKTYLGQLTLEELKLQIRAQLAQLEQLKATIARAIQARIKAEPDLKARFDLLKSLPGVGPIVAMALVVRMPELSSMRKGEAAALAGVAPFDHDSGQFKGQRFVWGGRKHARGFLYMAALSAKKNAAFRGFAQRLHAKDKPRKVVLVAVMRKLIEAANLVLARGLPWLQQPAT
jgi:transposase